MMGKIMGSKAKMSDRQFILELVAKYSEMPKGKIGTTRDTIVTELLMLVKDKTVKKISKLNGSGSSVYDSTDPTFDLSAEMVAQDIANAIVNDKPNLAIMCYEQAANDVLVQQAHLRLDF